MSCIPQLGVVTLNFGKLFTMGFCTSTTLALIICVSSLYLWHKAKQGDYEFWHCWWHLQVRRHLQTTSLISSITNECISYQIVGLWINGTRAGCGGDHRLRSDGASRSIRYSMKKTIQYGLF